MKKAEQSKNRTTQKSLLSIIHQELVLAYPAVKALAEYPGFKEFRMYSFLTHSDKQNVYDTFRYHSKDRDRGERIANTRPMYAQYMAIAQKGEYRKKVSKQLVQKRIIIEKRFPNSWFKKG